MKTLFQNLKQAFNALEFTNASHLNALTEMLTPGDRVATPAQTEHRIERHNHSLEHFTGATASSN